MPALPPPPKPAPPAWTWQPRRVDRPAEIQARHWLADRLGAAPEGLPLSRDPRGRPRLGAPLQRHDCSWSHSGQGLLVALGADMQVGIDLEWQRPRPRAALLARRYFSRAEADWLDAVREAAARETLFLRLWCAKEAVLKAHGHGLSFGLHRLEFGLHRLESAPSGGSLRLLACDPALGHPRAWTLQELQPAPGYLGALAWRAAGGGADPAYCAPS